MSSTRTSTATHACTTAHVLDAASQRQTIIRHLRKHGSITTLQARALGIMSPAARVFELKQRQHDIFTILVGPRHIAQYVLLTPPQKPRRQS